MPDAFPSITPSSAEFSLATNTRVFNSPLSGTTQTLSLPGARWRARLVFPPLIGSDKLTMQAFLTKLDGAAGRFYLGDPAYKLRGAAGAGGGTPLVNGASQTGTSLVTDGWTGSVTGVLKAGDYLSYDTSAGRELHMVTADANSDGSGNATFTIAPKIRTSPANNAAITYVSPTCIMRLVDDDQAKWALQAVKSDIAANISIDTVETFFS